MQRLSRLLCAILLLCGCCRAGADPEVFELRTPAVLFGRTLTMTDSHSTWLLGAFSFQQRWNQETQRWDEYAALTTNALDVNSGEQLLTFFLDGGTTVAGSWSATTNLDLIANARNADHVLWLDFKPGAEVTPTQNFLISSDSTGDALGLVQPGNAGGPPVASALSVAAEVIELPGNAEGRPVFSGHRASATMDPAKPFWVVDFTIGKRAPTGATLIRDGWVDDPAAYPLASVTFYFDQRLAGNRFTLHWQFPGQPEMVQSLVAVPGNSGEQQLGDGSREDETDTVSLTGSVALGSNYWITRASDGWSSGTWNIDPFAARPAPLQWSLRGTGIAPVPWQTVTFFIASGMGGTASVLQTGGMRALSPAHYGSSLADYDESGNPHFFLYDEWTAVINAAEPFWLIAGNTTCSLGETWFTNGWTALNGTPPLWQTARFTIASGIAWSQYVSQSNGTPALTLAGSGYQTRDYFADGTPNFLHYDLWDAVVDANRPFFLNVNGTALPANETVFTNGWQWQGGGAPDLRIVSFLIPNTSINGFNPYATQNQQNLTLSYGGQQGFIEDYVNDGSGTPHFFYYLVYTATVDVSRPFTLTATDPDGTGSPVTLGDHETIFYNGWTAQNGAKVSRISLNGDRATHGFQFLAPDGTAFPWEPAGAQEMQSLTLWDPWSWNPDTGATGLNWTLGYSVFKTVWGGDFSGQTGYWYLKDMTTDEQWQFNPGGAAVCQLDLRQWWLPAQSFTGLQISLSRWGHDLRVRQRDGGEYPVVQLASQGSTTFTPGGTALESYYYFDATGSRRNISGMDWWIYDFTTGEYAAANTTDLITWYYTPKPIQLSFTQSDLTAVDLKWDLPATLESGLLDGGFIIERFNAPYATWDAVTTGAATSFQISPDTNTLAFHHTDSGLSPGTYTYRICYTYGGQTGEAAALAATVNDAATLDGMDSNRNGVSDLDEILTATIPGYTPPSVTTDPTPLSVQAGASMTFTANVAGGSGSPGISLGSAQSLHFGTITAEPNTTGTGVRLTYAANPGVTGTENIAVIITDEYHNRTDSVSIAIIPAVVAVSLEFLIAGPVEITLGATGGSSYTYAITVPNNPELGTLSAINQATGTVTYTPKTTYGDDSFKYSANGGVEAEVKIQIRPFDYVSIGFGENMTGVVGDEIPSILPLGTSGRKRHFVSPKKTTAIDQANVVLKANFISREGKAFDELYEWFVDDSSWGTSSTLYLPRSAADKMVVTIRKQDGGQVMAEMNVWIVWTKCTPTKGTATFRSGENILMRNGQAATGSVYGICGNPPAPNTVFRFVFTILPEAIVNTAPGADIPSLKDASASDRPVPGADKKHYLVTTGTGDPVAADSAKGKWDISRRMKLTIKNKGISKEQLQQAYPDTILAKQPADEDTPIDFPKDDAEGNDDVPKSAQNNDPYTKLVHPYYGHELGELRSVDAPVQAALYSWGGAEKRFAIQLDFVEFARVQLWDGVRAKESGRFWFRISDFNEAKWHHHFRTKWTFGANVAWDDDPQNPSDLGIDSAQ